LVCIIYYFMTIALSRISYEVVQRLAAKYLIRYRVALFRFVIFLSIYIHVHNAFHLGVLINHVMRRTTTESTTRCWKA
jgi:cbb3-type cytochrome oxidase subunit 1